MKIARPFMVMGRTSLKAVPLEIKQKERSPRILCFTAIAALIRDFAIPLPASSVFRCTVQRLLPELAAFLIEFLTEPGDLVVDPFAGLHKVPIAAERLGRRWLATDKIMEWLAISRNLFTAAPGYKSNPMLDELAELYRT